MDSPRQGQSQTDARRFGACDLTDRVALVTGAVQGLGLAVARAMSAAGATVLVNSRSAAAVDEVVTLLNTDGGSAMPAVFDVTDGAASGAVFDRFSETGTPIDVVVNNVGTRRSGPLEQRTSEEFAGLLQSNVTAAMVLAQQMCGSLAPGQTGRVINISSVSSIVPMAGNALYAATKAGLEGLTRGLSAELGPRGITVNAIAPGFFATESNRASFDDEGIRSWAEQRIALRRWGDPSEAAGVAVFLASDAASYVTGQTIVVDGGLTTSM